MSCLFDQTKRSYLWLLMACIAGLLLQPLAVFAEVVEPQAMTERVLWKKTPIAVKLRVGEERLIHFPGSVSVGMPPALQAVLRSQSINGTLYLMAHQPFTSQRLILHAEQEGPLYVLDVTAEIPEGKESSLPAMQIVLPEPTPNQAFTQPATKRINLTRQWGYVALTRYAAQQRYAPTRLLRKQAGIVQVPVAQKPVELVRGGYVEATPVAAWRVGFYTVTAVNLLNQSLEPVELDPRHLRGNWLTATFQHNRLLPVGSDADSTTLYLISDRSFELSL